MTETADLNDPTESLFTVFRGTVPVSLIIREKNDCCLSCMRVDGIWYERECMFRENLTGGMSMSVFGIANAWSYIAWLGVHLFFDMLGFANVGVLSYY